MSVQSYVEVRQRFTASLQALVKSAYGMWQAVTGKGPTVHYKPDLNGWDGNLFDIEGMSKAFSREEHQVDVQKAVASVANSGTVGDLVASVKQGDYLAVQERAFRMRHLGRVRASCHAAARHYGHQHAAGVLLKGVKGEVELMVKRAKDFPRG